MSGSTGFSVIVTCYNYRAFVVEAVDSALAQTRAPAQIIVVDDGSTDGSAELLRERYGHDARVILLCGPNGGQLSAFVHGMQRAEQEVVCFLDADDRWQPDYLERIGALYDSRRDIDFVFSDVHLFGDADGVESYAKGPLDLGYTAVGTWISAHWYGAPTSALSLRRPWARRTLDLPVELLSSWRISADNCLVFGASVLGARKYFLPTGAVNYRIHGSNGWWHNRQQESQFPARFRTRCLINYYAGRIGMDEIALDLIKAEYMTKPAPSWAETKRYARAAMYGSAPWSRRFRRSLSILRKGMRHRFASSSR